MVRLVHPSPCASSDPSLSRYCRHRLGRSVLISKTVFIGATNNRMIICGADDSESSSSGIHSWWYRGEPAPWEDLSDDSDDETSLCDGHDQQLLCSADHEIQEPTVLCVDLTESIETLLASALYHRSSLGLHGALIGIACDRTSTVVRVIIGWLDEYVEVGQDLVSLRAVHSQMHHSLIYA